MKRVLVYALLLASLSAIMLLIFSRDISERIKFPSSADYGLLSINDVISSNQLEDNPQEDIWQQEQSRRREVIKRTCPLYSSLRNNTHVLKDHPGKFSNFLVDEKHKAIYCYVPKVACTEWKRLLLAMTNSTGFKIPSKIPHMHAHSAATKLSLSNYKPYQIQHRLKNYKKFMFVRHPLERLVSAFRDKFEADTLDARNFRLYHAKSMMKLFRKQSDIPDSGESIKFWEFIGFLAHKDPHVLQEHWKPFYEICYPCAIDYDYIGKYSTLEEDSNMILKSLNADDKYRFPAFNRTKTLSLVDSYIDSVPIDILQVLKEHYEPDFMLYEYSWVHH